MPLKRALVLLALAAAASLALSFGLSVAAGDSPQSPPQLGSVTWTERPDSVAALDALSTTVVEAEVVSVTPGPDLFDPSELDQDSRLPTQRITLRTLQTLEGQAPPLFELFKTGSTDLYLEDDPPYEAGERYVLFLEPRQGEPGTFLPAAPDGRLLLDADGRAQGLIEGPVDQDLSGKTPAEIDQEVSG